MKMLMGVLQSDRPASLDESTIRKLLVRNNRAECLEDAWGRRFLIEVNDSSGNDPDYTVISLARDGKRGACCIKWTSDWDADAVLQGEHWLQVWYPKGATQ